MTELLAIRAESLYEELGGDLCVCQNSDVPHWCKKCQGRIAYILTVFSRLRGDGEAQRTELLAALKDAVRTIRTWHGMGMSANEAQAWALYQASPEMRRINEAIAKAEGRS